MVDGAVLVHCGPQLLDVFYRYAFVEIAEVSHPRCLHRTRVTQQRRERKWTGRHDAAAVVRDRRTELTAGGREKCDATAEAEAENRDLVVGETGTVQMIEGGVDVHEDAVIGDRFE